VTSAFSFAETGLTFTIISLVFWFGTTGEGFDFDSFFKGDSHVVAQLLASMAYLLAVLFLEPFYVAAGFGMYLNRRAELEAWDIEQEFRRAFAS